MDPEKPLITGDDPDEHAFRQYRAPRHHGQVCFEPAIDQVPSLLEQNLRTLTGHPESWQTLRTAARSELIEAAIRYTSAYRETDWVTRAGPIIMAGHQPAIFHPGVWFKNFALSEIASRIGGIAINLVIDNDVAGSRSVRVPTINPSTGVGSYQNVAYDIASGGVPYEQTTIRDQQQFDRFDSEVADAIAPIVSDPLVRQLWDHARSAIARCGVAGCALAQARHGLEGELGLRTLELPLGVICRTQAFAQTVIAILADLPRFHADYNTATEDYRRVHGIRSSAHPVPNLAREGDWWEAPLWIYGDDAPQRRPAWVRQEGEKMIISDRAGRDLSLDAKFPKLAAEKLAGHASPNFKLRPRALLTTLYARMILSDLFLHGIGGAKYDQLGDMIIRRFFGVEPPSFMVISATVQLPGYTTNPHDPDPSEQLFKLRRAIRDTRYQGERFADQHPLSPLDVQQKLELLSAVPPRGERQQWTREVDAVNRRLSDQLAPLRAELRTELQQRKRQIAKAEMLTSREHPFCLFPVDYLTGVYRKLLG